MTPLIAYIGRPTKHQGEPIPGDHEYLLTTNNKWILHTTLFKRTTCS